MSRNDRQHQRQHFQSHVPEMAVEIERELMPVHNDVKEILVFRIQEVKTVDVDRVEECFLNLLKSK